MKKKVTILLLALCLLFVTACGSPSPSDALKADMENAKSSPDEIMSDVSSDGFSEEANQALVNKMLEFEYEIGEEKVDGDTATVELTVTTYPFGDIFTQLVSDIMDKAMSGEIDANATEDEIMAQIEGMLIDAMDDAEKSYVKTITVNLAMEDDAWVVQEDDDFNNAITGGLYEAFAS